MAKPEPFYLSVGHQLVIPSDTYRNIPTLIRSFSRVCEVGEDAVSIDKGVVKINFGKPIADLRDWVGTKFICFYVGNTISLAIHPDISTRRRENSIAILHRIKITAIEGECLYGVLEMSDYTFCRIYTEEK